MSYITTKDVLNATGNLPETVSRWMSRFGGHPPTHADRMVCFSTTFATS